MACTMVVRLRPEPRAAIDEILDRIYLLAVTGEAELAQFGEECGDAAGETARPGAALVLVVTFRSRGAAARFAERNADLLTEAIEAPLFFAPSPHAHESVLPPLFG